MASGLKYSVGATLLGMALVAIWLLPVGSEKGPQAPVVLTPELDRFLSLQHSLQIETAHLQRLVWLDSLASLLSGSSNTDAPVVGLPSDYAPGARARLEQRLRVEVRALAPLRAQLGVFVIRVPDGMKDGSVTWDERYVGEVGGRPFCAVVRLSRARPGSRSYESWGDERAPQILGSCAYVARYGVPGPSVSGWLKQGGFPRGGWERLPAGYARYLGGEDELAERAAVGDVGFVRERNRGLSLAAHACLQGELQRCEDVFLHPKGSDEFVSAGLATRIPELWASSATDPSSSHFGVIEPLLLHDLEREFGAERFERFWTSDQSLADAFEGAFGVSAGAWMQRWARGYLTKPGTPLLAGAGRWAGTVFTLMLAMLVVMRVASRRSLA